ncbi:hypothetical protein [Brevibacterium sp.]|uniref:hypothetical protein n=1 Tax=Brevibacterium sp. TaxID=1701 RepID=UPI0028118C4C|nr:hypothetical protein [Brevibacterium sp.]
MRLKNLSLAVASGVAIAICATPGAAFAATGPSDQDLREAASAVHAPDGLSLLRSAAGAPKPSPGALAPQTSTQQKVAADGIPVYALNPDFVSGHSKDPAELWYIAYPATHNAEDFTIFAAQDDAGRWSAVNVATGHQEADYVKDAPADSRLLVEPQVSAWYGLKDGEVEPLNDAAVKAIGSSGPVPVADYRQHVSSAYGSKLPGSSYAKSGKAGGFGAGAPSPAGSVTPQPDTGAAHSPVAETAGTLAPPLFGVWAGAGAVALAALGLGWLLHRRKNR